MTETILVLNTGSSSLKASLLCEAFGEDGQSEDKHLVRIITAHGERLGTKESFLHISISSSAVESIIKSSRKDTVKDLKRSDSLPLTSRATNKQSSQTTLEDVQDFEISEEHMTHQRAIELVIENIKICSQILFSSISAVGHRVVHGGATFSDSVLVNPQVISAIEAVSHLAPLHNPSNLQGIRISSDVFKDIPNVAVFDTAFHSTMEEYVYRYALPGEYSAHGIRKYGFHGTSVKYVSAQASHILKSFGYRHSRMIVAHLGNGASCTAVKDGKSMDTTMEFSPLTGLIMGTRSGNVDPTVVTYAAQQLGKSPSEVIEDLNKRSGLKAICGENDMRTVISKANDGDTDAKLAIDMFIYILSKQIAGLIVACGGYVDALVFTAGIGEHSSFVRSLVLHKIGSLLGNVELCEEWNESDGKLNNGIISQVHTPMNDKDCVVMVVPTDEESMIFYDCKRVAGIM